MTRRLGTVLKIALAAGLLAALVHAGLLDLRRLRNVGERWPWLLLAHVPFSLLLLAAALRWHLLLRVQNVRLRFRDTYGITLVGWLFNQTLPSATGGDIAKAVAVTVDHPERGSAAVVSIAIDRLIGLTVLLSLALVMAWLNWSLVGSSGVLWPIVFGIAAALSCVGAAALLFYSGCLRRSRVLRALGRRLDHALPSDRSRGAPARFVARVRSLAANIESAAYAYRDHGGTLLTCAGLSLILHTMTLAVNFCLTWALLGTPFAWQALLLLVPLAHIGMALGITPGSIGVAEGVYYQLFSVVGIQQGGLVCILQRLLWYTWAAIGACVLVARRSRRAPLEPLTTSLKPNSSAPPPA